MTALALSCQTAMASKAYRFCGWPGCNELCKERYCDKHAGDAEKKQADDKAAYQRARPSAAKQGYGRQWQKARLAYLRRNPLCEDCKDQGRIVPAVLVHHITPVKDQGARLDPGNLKSLCVACHEAIHGKDRWKSRT